MGILAFSIPREYQVKAVRRNGNFTLQLYKRYGKRRYHRGYFDSYHALGQYLRKKG